MDQVSEKDKLLTFCSSKGHCNLHNKTYEACASFLFYTSWFEELLFNDIHRQCAQKNEKICQDLVVMIDISKYDFLGNFLSDRYIVGENTSGKFHHLKLNNSQKEDVRNALYLYKTNQTHDWKLLWAYLMVVYRFRNNMFHGNKGLVNINEYVDPFCLFNDFLRLLIGDILDNQYKGYNAR